MKNLTFADMANAVLAGYEGRDASFSSRLQFWIDRFGEREVVSLTVDDVEDGIDALAARGKVKVLTVGPKDARAVVREPTDRKLSGATINRYVAALGSAFAAARKPPLRILPRGFTSPMRGVSRQGEGKGRIVDVTVEDVRRLVASCRVSRNRRLAAMVAMACTTGWRKGSLQALTWGALNLADGFADAQRTKNGTPHRCVLLPWVVEELRRIRPARAEASDLVFGPAKFDKAWQTAIERANLPATWTFHHCRHIAASILAQSGASVPVVMAALNHKTPAMALRYSHLNVDTLRSAMGAAWA